MTAPATLRDSCGGIPLSTFMLGMLARVGPTWMQAQTATTTN